MAAGASFAKATNAASRATMKMTAAATRAMSASPALECEVGVWVVMRPRYGRPGAPP